MVIMLLASHLVHVSGIGRDPEIVPSRIFGDAIDLRRSRGGGALEHRTIDFESRGILEAR